jgi:methionyl-tRNA formyltransferase
MAIGGAPLVLDTLAGLENGTVKPKPQDHSRATLAPLLAREDGRINFARHTATQIKNRWRGFQPWPGAFTALEGKKLIAHKLDIATVHAPSSLAAGQVMISEDHIFAACAGNTWLELLELQLEGKKRLGAAEFLRGTHLATGMRLG